MSSSLNEFQFIGNLGTAPESKRLESDRQMTRLFVITNKTWTNKHTGEKHEKSEAFNVVVFGQPAEFLAKYARKGDKVLLRGEVRNAEWTDKQTGEKCSGIEFVVSGYDAKVMLFGKQAKDDDHGEHHG